MERTRSNTRFVSSQVVDVVAPGLGPVDTVALRQMASTLAPPCSTRVAGRAREGEPVMWAMVYER